MYYEERDRHTEPTVFIGEKEVTLPTSWAICGTCSGNGTHSLKFGAFSGERLQEAQQDEEFWQAYLSGQMDDACQSCAGTGKIRSVDESSMAPEMAQAWKEDQEAEDLAYSERRAEYMMSGEYLNDMRSGY